MTIITGAEARALFHTTLNNQRRLKQTPEWTLGVIQEIFQKLAEAKGELAIGERSIRVEDLGTSEVNHLCRVCRKFFRNQENLSIDGKLLSNIEKVKQNKHYTESYGGEISNVRSLNAIKELIYLNESPEIESGTHVELQDQLRDEIKQKAQDLRKMRRNGRIKVAAFITGGVLGCIGSVAGGFALMAAGAAGGGFALLFFGSLASIGASIGAALRVKSQVEKAQRAQDNRIWAFELLKDANAFQTHCQQRALDPESVTVEALIKNRDKKAVV